MKWMGYIFMKWRVTFSGVEGVLIIKWRGYVWWSGGFNLYEMEGVCLMKWRSDEVERRGRPGRIVIK